MLRTFSANDAQCSQYCRNTQHWPRMAYVKLYSNTQNVETMLYALTYIEKTRISIFVRQLIGIT